MGKRRDPKYVQDQLKAAKGPTKKEGEEPAMSQTVAEQLEQMLGDATVTEEPTEQAEPTTEEPIIPKEPKKRGRKAKEPVEPKELPQGAVNCKICGKTLTDPKSVTRNIGPVCAAAMQRLIFAGNDETFQKFVKEADDEAWTREVLRVRDLLKQPHTLTEVPEGYIPMSEAFRLIAIDPGINGHRLIRFFGGDRMAHECYSEAFVPVYVEQANKRPRKYVPAACLEAAKHLPEKGTRKAEKDAA